MDGDVMKQMNPVAETAATVRDLTQLYVGL